LIKIITISIFLLISTISFSKEQKILKITNSKTKNIGYIFIETNDDTDEITSFRYDTFKPSGEVLDEPHNMPFEDFLEGDIGMVGLSSKMIFVTPHDFSSQDGGAVTIKYPLNFILGKFTTINIQLVKNDTSWEAYAPDDTKITHCHIVVSAFFLGVKKLQFK